MLTNADVCTQVKEVRGRMPVVESCLHALDVQIVSLSEAKCAQQQQRQQQLEQAMALAESAQHGKQVRMLT